MLKIAIVGTGGIAQRHMRGLATIPDARFVAMVDRDRKRAEEAAHIFGGEVFDTLKDALPHVDVVYVLTPPSFHRELSVQALRAKKQVIVEKPIAIKIEDAESMVEEAEKAGVQLIVTFNMRFRKGFRKLKATVESGKLGPIVNLWSQRLGIGFGEEYNWRTDPKLLCGMSIESLSHDIDLIRWFGGDISNVRANTYNSRKDLPGFDDSANVALTMKSGAGAMIHSCWHSYAGLNSRGVVGEEGTAYVSGPGLWECTGLHWKTKDMENEQIEVFHDPLDDASYLEENRHFLECIDEGSTPLVTGMDGLKALRVSHGILKSSRENCIVTI